MASTAASNKEKGARGQPKAMSPVPAQLPTYVNFAIGMGSGVSGWLFVHPADVVKVRMQLSGSGGGGMVTTARGIFQQEGVTGECVKRGGET
jgi:solute carrier family 25 (mitochondrial oxoglutarate transporter), member 11